MSIESERPETTVFGERNRRGVEEAQVTFSFGRLHFILPQKRHDMLRVLFLRWRTRLSLD